MKQMLLAIGALMVAIPSVATAEQGDEPSSEYNLLYVPTPQIVVNRMLEMADVNGDDVLYDLGCGDGRIVITAAKAYGTEGVGVDLNPQRIQESRQNAREAGVTERVEFQKKDVFNTDISEATVVTLYLLPEVMRKLSATLIEELAPGARIISHDFDFPRWEPDRTIRINGLGKGAKSFGTESGEGGEVRELEVGEVDLTPKEKRRQTERLTRTHTLHYWVVPAQLDGAWQARKLGR